MTLSLTQDFGNELNENVRINLIFHKHVSSQRCFLNHFIKK